jgi:hypothetical protein
LRICKDAGRPAGFSIYDGLLKRNISLFCNK